MTENYYIKCDSKLFPEAVSFPEWVLKPHDGCFHTVEVALLDDQSHKNPNQADCNRKLLTNMDAHLQALLSLRNQGDQKAHDEKDRLLGAPEGPAAPVLATNYRRLVRAWKLSRQV